MKEGNEGLVAWPRSPCQEMADEQFELKPDSTMLVWLWCWAVMRSPRLEQSNWISPAHTSRGLSECGGSFSPLGLKMWRGIYIYKRTNSCNTGQCGEALQTQCWAKGTRDKQDTSHVIPFKWRSNGDKAILRWHQEGSCLWGSLLHDIHCSHLDLGGSDPGGHTWERSSSCTLQIWASIASSLYLDYIN